ncbi:MAG: ATP-dependent DNA helicase RecG [Peptoniphilus sp.]|nr:ATP-dependent DNA helicase RecG [Peptoniphilus sp.]MDD7362955.1 ATP-dependent DNA helicase RecG [Bacillota bacterium]MDY6044195.1 ATP-dependent DNA helicase RecG [Peptoniphilus sp.]
MIHSSIKTISGIGDKTAEKLKKMHITVVEDLLYTLPYRYEDGTHLRDFAHADFDHNRTYRVRLLKKGNIRYLKKGLKLQQFTVTDGVDVGEIALFNMPFMDRKLRIDDVYYLYGKPKYFKGKIQFTGPKIYTEDEKKAALSITPIYPLVEGIGQGSMKKYIQNALSDVEVPSIVPAYLRKRYGLLTEDEAIRTLHRPDSMEAVNRARQSLVFSEFLCFQLALGRFDEKRGHEGFVMDHEELSDAILSGLPFELTDGQEAAWEDIKDDMASPRRMERLVQGDVGSGKTILAFLAMARAVASGYQAMMMAPTEILARQHYEDAFQLLLPLGVRVELLTGSTKPAKRREILDHFKTGACDILIGTHALFEEDIDAERIGLTVTDEQHRFGVMQRERLQEKQSKSDRLIMTATPIPRSLGIVMYGNTDISSIRTMPKGRKAVETTVIGDEGLEGAYAFIERFLQTGQQVYVVCPLIEENPDLSLHAAESVYRYFKRTRFKRYGVGLIHGQQSPEEKNAVMEAFQANDYQILISTTVIEVGVNVVNANLLFVFDADRFGLATLHQLRGRVGRGDNKAYCILHSSNRSLKSQQRLGILAQSSDGFYIAEEDMKLRGGGDFFGTRQSGIANFRVGDLFEDMDIMRYAKIESDAILKGGHLNVSEEPDLLAGVEAYEERIRGV